MSDNQLYTLSEVKLNNGRNSRRCWIIISYAVYDVTDYIKNHPGGEELILDVAGRDCTKEFNEAAHSTDARKLFQKYKIGEVFEGERESNQKKNIQLNAEKLDGTAKNLEKTIGNDQRESFVEDVSRRRRRFRFFFCA